jgi:hypothetical protein
MSERAILPERDEADWRRFDRLLELMLRTPPIRRRKSEDDPITTGPDPLLNLLRKGKR